jgi:hypothetical protein
MLVAGEGDDGADEGDAVSGAAGDGVAAAVEANDAGSGSAAALGDGGTGGVPTVGTR